ncbi:ABC transporter ATP-binding protein [Wenzhouxiangella sp. EGI_FJ10305]|uniref:ABC transporter ATP-binding protein n=1 Tax=Wenzhouxiangella sp. EGI_FJ10305 TaxID=3243768 RepID=UPI0035E145E2
MALMLIGAMAEMLTLGAVIPFVSLLADPATAFEFPGLQALFQGLGWHDPEAIVTPMTLLFIGVIVLASSIRVLLLITSTRFIHALGAEVGVTMYRRILRQPYRFHVAQHSSEVIAALNKVQSMLNSVVKPALDGLIALVLGLAILGMMVYLQPVATLLAVVTLILFYFGIAGAVRHRLKGNSRTIARTQSRRVRSVQEGLGGIRDILLANRQDRVAGAFARVDRTLRDAQATNTILNQLPQPLIQTLGMVLVIAFAWFLAQQSDGITHALPILGALALGAQRLFPMLQRLYSAWSRLTGNHQTFADVLGFLELDEERGGTGQASTALAFRDCVRLERVSFRYPGAEEDVLSEITLVIQKGRQIGICGPTGAGKSTLVDLVMGLLEPTGGRLWVDGTLVDATNRHLWGQRIAHVPQDVFLLDASFAENIALGDCDEEVDMTRVTEAARAAQVSEFIEAQPDGYLTRIGERGVRLSGGQRQRIALARALYRNAEFIVLDEATSALDSETEASVMRAVHQIEGVRTLLVIAHRQETLSFCDEVIRLDGGSVEPAYPNDRHIFQQT